MLVTDIQLTANMRRLSMEQEQKKKKKKEILNFN